jgi:hypothetical protein
MLLTKKVWVCLVQTLNVQIAYFELADTRIEKIKHRLLERWVPNKNYIDLTGSRSFFSFNLLYTDFICVSRLKEKPYTEFRCSNIQCLFYAIRKSGRRRGPQLLVKFNYCTHYDAHGIAICVCLYGQTACFGVSILLQFLAMGYESLSIFCLSSFP